MFLVPSPWLHKPSLCKMRKASVTRYQSFEKKTLAMDDWDSWKSWQRDETRSRPKQTSNNQLGIWYWQLQIDWFLLFVSLFVFFYFLSCPFYVIVAFGKHNKFDIFWGVSKRPPITIKRKTTLASAWSSQMNASFFCLLVLVVFAEEFLPYTPASCMRYLLAGEFLDLNLVSLESVSFGCFLLQEGPWIWTFIS